MINSKTKNHVDEIIEKSSLLEEEASIYYFKEPTNKNSKKVDTSYITVYKD